MALPPKRDVALQLLERSTLMIHLDPRREGVVVPPWFKKQPQLLLQVGYNMPVPIRDLEVGEPGISCTLSFNRSPFYCVLPWSAVYALVGDDGRGMVWPEDVPREVAEQHAAQARAAEEKKRVEAARSRLRAIPGGGSTPPPAPAAGEPAPQVVMGASCNAPSPPEPSRVTPRTEETPAAPPQPLPASAPVTAESVEAPAAAAPAPRRKRARKAAPKAPAAPVEAVGATPSAPAATADPATPAKRARRARKAVEATPAPAVPRGRKKAPPSPEPAPSATQVAAPSPGGRRPLPPYLRVVK